MELNPLKWRFKGKTGLDEEIQITIGSGGLKFDYRGDGEFWLLHPWIKWGWPWKALGIPGKALEQFSYFMSGEWRKGHGDPKNYDGENKIGGTDD